MVGRKLMSVDVKIMHIRHVANHVSKMQKRYRNLRTEENNFDPLRRKQETIFTQKTGSFPLHFPCDTL
jgi:hypothetical protein